MIGTTAVAAEPRTPEWVADAIFYQIFPDRFARSLTVPKPSNLQPWGSTPTYHGYMGGDLVGVVERLDYLCDLGINAIYFTPIFQSASNHRYHTHDYEKVDPMLGGNEALRRLIDAAHGRGIRVVLDGVFNHASRGFFQFHDILENGADSAYLDWFEVRGFPLHAYSSDHPPNYAAWWNLPALPKFNIRTPAVREFLWETGRRWIEFGIDGWRLDVPNEIDDDSFWREFRRRIKAANPEAYIVGEVWHESQRWLQGDMWDAVMNYLFTRACIGFFIGQDVDRGELDRTVLSAARPLDAAAFSQEIRRMLGLYHPAVNLVMLNLLDSHDMARFVTLARGDTTALRLATVFQMTYVGAPSIFYGDEIGLSGGHDPLNRAAFPWDQARWDLPLFHHFQRLIALRHASPALRRGSFTTLLADAGILAYLRRHQDDTVLVAINTEDRPRAVNISARRQIPDEAELDEVWASNSLKAEAGVFRHVELPARSARIFRAQGLAPASAPPDWP
ncbi:MAG: alpha-amylase [Isosphaeraceae bacterium]|nr:MAG: alpha-amylase [Isosphaeraceae bacterium]